LETNMTTHKTKTRKPLELRSGLRAGGLNLNHNTTKIRTGVRAAGGVWNHNSTKLTRGSR
jgi:hypothetical protein